MPPPDRPTFGSQPSSGDLPARYATVHDMYQQASNERSMRIFPGDFINFGYWRNLRNAPLTEETRIQSQQNLYKLMFEKLGITHNTQDTLLEVACGKGKGLELLYDTYTPRGKIYGVDFVTEQVQRTQAILQSKSGNFEIYQNAAEDLRNIGNKSVDRALSVEAIQHFESPERFVDELSRVVKPGGRVAITSFFTEDTSAEKEKTLKDLFPTMANGIDKTIDINAMKRWLEASGFRDLEITSIKEDVLPYFSKWLNHSLPDYSSTAWADASEQGLLDYFIITAQKI
ncbi:MAG TPA: class I SAM-dependent methyltransferase [Methylomirabilota bacterium]|nr:class I SAM-dependent methyltransferase [Methylomirabilota bacterium]